MNFKDYFSSVSQGYASFRPSYPPELFRWLASLPARRNFAWDCACGSGQAAIHLADHFDRVAATDASAAQIASAPREAANIEWRAAPAEASGLPGGSVDLITVAQALHWFDRPKFFAEAKRVLHPGGAIAVWCYGINTVEDQAVNDWVQDFYSNVVGPYWPPERRIVEAGYRTREFPFQEITVPSFAMDVRWDLPRFLGYFRTWSAVTRYIAAKGVDPVRELERKLTPVWGPPEQERLVRWPLSGRAGRLR
jgi:SAM-dependent methyltransferase